MIDPERIPEIRPDKRKFWLLRLLAWMLFFGGLALFAFGGVHGALVFYGTKNGAEIGRLVGASAYILGSLIGGSIMMATGQVFRVLIAIEENLRLVAYHTRPRLRPTEPPQERKVAATPPERMRA